MSTCDAFIKKPPVGEPFVFPEPPERNPDDMTSFNQVSITGKAHYPAEHLGNPGTTSVGANITSVPYPPAT